VVRTYAPVGQTPILREWWAHEHLSAISALSPEGKLYFHSQGRALNSDDVVGFLEHLLREVPGPMVIIVAGAQRGDLALQLSDQRQQLLTTHRWVAFGLTHGMQYRSWMCRPQAKPLINDSILAVGRSMWRG
jgi:hypothetical protein